MNSKYDKELRPSKLLNNILQPMVVVDVYDVIKAFNVTSAPIQHLLKKALCAGDRGHKDRRQDIVDIIDSAKRELEMIDSTTVPVSTPTPPICHNTDCQSFLDGHCIDELVKYGTCTARQLVKESRCNNMVCGSRNTAKFGNCVKKRTALNCDRFFGGPES